MKKFKYVVVLQVEVEAFSTEDAKDMLSDTYGTGEDCGIETIDVTIKESR